VRVIRRVADGEGKILTRVRTLLWLVTFASLLAFVGGCIGYALGLLLARFLGTRIFGVPPEPSLLVLGVVIVLAACVTLLGSALPLRRAARFDPAPILRGE
jgi:putative ABC transport system permease protein